MLSAAPLSKDIFWVGANDRETDLFESIWPLPRGVSYNSYVIADQKVALVDTVKHNAFDRHISLIRQAIGTRPVDYLIVNHMEPDHSGSISLLLNVFPDLKIVGNKKTADFLQQFYGISSNIVVVEDRGVLDLGAHKLEFHLTPMVHWPETMMTFDLSDKVLFSADAFGGFGALDGGIFDDEVDIAYFEDEILRYFANIVAKYAPMVERAIEKLKGLDIKIVAPTHGPVWRKDPASIISRYSRWSRYEAEEGVVIAYGSMYGNTERMMEVVSQGLSDEDITRIRIHDVSRSHASFILRDAWRYKALILGSPTYDTKLFPPMDNLVRLIAEKKLKNRLLGLFGTYGWSGGGVGALTEFAKDAEMELVEPVVEARCAPKDTDLVSCRLLGQNMVKRLKAKAESA